MTSMGIHQVAVAQYKRVKPLRKCNSGLRMVELSAAAINVVPAFYTLLAQDRRKKSAPAAEASPHGAATHHA